MLELVRSFLALLSEIPPITITATVPIYLPILVVVCTMITLRLLNRI